MVILNFPEIKAGKFEISLVSLDFERNEKCTLPGNDIKMKLNIINLHSKGFSYSFYIRFQKHIKYN